MERKLKTSIHNLIKFGNEANMKSMYEKGVLYLNPIEYFRLLEEQGYGRGDSYEGTTLVSNLRDSDVYVMVDGDWKLLGTTSHTHLHGYKEQMTGNLYCMYAVHPGAFVDGAFRFDARIKDFGSHCVIVQEQQNAIFCERIFAALIRAGYPVHITGLVEYFDHEAPVIQQTNVFMKRAGFSFQNEFRIFVHNHVYEPIKLEIGSIADIASLYETKLLSLDPFYASSDYER